MVCSHPLSLIHRILSSLSDLQRSQWYSTIDVGDRAKAAYGDRYIDWDIKIRKPADMVIINLGTNDHRNNITGEEFFESYVKLIDGVRKAWPKAEVVMMVGYFLPHLTCTLPRNSNKDMIDD